MPIYAYRCADCGHAKDVLQKMSDPPLTTCPSCGQPRFEKQVTAAGFQLKGSGWYVTDFREGQKKKAETAADKAGDKPADKGASAPSPADAKSGSTKAGSDAAGPAPAAAPAPAAPAPPPAAPPASDVS